MQQDALTVAYLPHRTPQTESSESLRRRIPGWGADLDPADRPQVPREQPDPDLSGAHWEVPESQPAPGYRERSIEHAGLTPAFGTAQPLKGLSGVLRRFSYERYSEARLAHWLLLMAADRVDVVESTVGAALRGRPDNPVAETGVRAELTGHGLRSRMAGNRVDVRHHVVDPLIVAGPWAAGAVAGYRVTRRVLQRGR